MKSLTLFSISLIGIILLVSFNVIPNADADKTPEELLVLNELDLYLEELYNYDLSVKPYQNNTSLPYTSGTYELVDNLLLEINNPGSGIFFGLSVASTPDGNLLIGGGTGRTSLLDGTTGALLLTMSNPGYGSLFGYSVATTPNGDLLIGGPYNDVGTTRAGSAYLFDGTTGALLLTMNNPAPEEDDHFGNSVASTPNGNLLIGAHYDNAGAYRAGSAYLYDGTTGALLLTMNNPAPEEDDWFGSSVASTPNGNLLIGAAFDDTSAYLYDGTTGALLLTMSNPGSGSGLGYSVASTPDGNLLLGGLSTNSAYLYDGTTGALLVTANNPTFDSTDWFGYSVASTPDGNLLIGARWDNTGATKAGSAYLYDGTTGALLLTMNNPTPEEDESFGNSVASTPNGNLLIGAYRDNTGRDMAGSVYLFGFDTVPPVLSPIPTQSVDYLGTLTFTATATDEDTAPEDLRFSLNNAPEGATINGITGEFSWSIADSQYDGMYTFDVTVTDGMNTDSQSVTVNMLFCGEALSYYDKYYYGTESFDFLIGSIKSDLVLAFGGNDYISTSKELDCIYGGDGDDLILAGENDDIVYGGDGNDYIIAGGGTYDIIFGESGDDMLTGNKLDVLDGGDGTDTCIHEIFRNSGIIRYNCEITE